MWLANFAMMRVLRRQVGSVGMADLLVIVIIADDAQNGMAGDAKSVTSTIVRIGTTVFWDHLSDYLGFKSKVIKVIKSVVGPKELELIRDGRIWRETWKAKCSEKRTC